MSFLRLPRELRDMMYEQYYAVENGYIYDAEHNKLTQADDGSPISLSLSLTCRQVASEVQGLAFRLNTITFTTSCSRRTQKAAAIFHATVGGITRRKQVMIRSLVSQLLTRDMVELAAKAYPQFAPVFNGWVPQTDIPILYKKDFYCGEAPSVWVEFTHHVLDLMSKHPLFVSKASAIPRIWGPDGNCRATQLNDASPKPWLIPDPTELERLASIFNVKATLPHYKPGTKYTYSAASTAIYFLRMLPNTLRSEIQNITLLEDRESVAYAKCHGRGFIEFCQSNPKLRVKCVVSLWQNALPVSPEMRTKYMLASQYPDLDYDLSRDRLLPKFISKALGSWMAEMMALPSLGMPDGSYRLVLDGEPTGDHTSDVFKAVQRDIAWQSALDEAYSRGLLPTPSWLERRLRVGYLYEGLPDIVGTMSDPQSLITCNFDPGSPLVVADMLKERRTWTPLEWAENWDTHEPGEYQTEAPMAQWHTLRYQRIFG
ncbi:uncharacterized protein J4E78_002729 [Alternaria triticimaculans]|uniref:uncharacterized protein n=1 Tax=Alternaria triticimaculans TaxID=297637 RepID=UPI0020C337CC|nr:uncharacterized protein J4E78_002729 [Alternaria triticimaculans]KAI4665269.1 hypothetical protein J4E78_002729 [Alternaria triticimaculans]